MSDVADAVARPVASGSPSSDVEAPTVPADVPAATVATAPASPQAPVPTGPVAFGTVVRIRPVATGPGAPSSLVAADPTAPALLQNAPRVFDAALSAWDDEEFPELG
jgi:hypothetical protein